jgi:hypothetical protein
VVNRRPDHEFIEAWLDAVLLNHPWVSKEEFRKYFIWRLARIDLHPKADLPAYIPDIRPDWYLDGYIWRSYAPRPPDQDDARWTREA